jgi:hypothetical protein
MNKHRLVLLAVIALVALAVTACGWVTWAGPHGGTCYSTLQSGCLQSILTLTPVP